MASIQTLDFGPFRRGDTIDPITFTLRIDGAPPAVGIIAVSIDLRKNGVRFHRYDSADNSITIDAFDQFTIPSHRLDIEGADYAYDCQINFANGVVKTYLQGVWQVVEDVTKDE